MYFTLTINKTIRDVYHNVAFIQLRRMGTSRLLPETCFHDSSLTRWLSFRLLVWVICLFVCVSVCLRFRFCFCFSEIYLQISYRAYIEIPQIFHMQGYKCFLLFFAFSFSRKHCFDPRRREGERISAF